MRLISKLDHYPVCMDSQPRKNFSYNKLVQKPLRLTVLKLDGSLFGIEVDKTGTVGDVKRAVEAVFSHLPKKGPGKVSWVHVWGQFCLCHEGQKLLNDKDYMGMFGIQDGDQLQFIRHSSSSYGLVRMRSEKEDLDLDDELSVSYRCCRDKLPPNGEKNKSLIIDIEEDNQDDDDDVESGISKFEYTVRNLLRGWLPYRRLTTSSSRFSSSIPGSFKNILWFYRKKNEFQRGSGNNDLHSRISTF